MIRSLVLSLAFLLSAISTAQELSLPQMLFPHSPSPEITIACDDDLSERRKVPRVIELGCKGASREKREALIIEKAMSLFPGTLEPLLMGDFGKDGDLHFLTMFVDPRSPLRGRYRLVAWFEDHAEDEQRGFAEHIFRRREKCECEVTQTKGWPFVNPRFRFFFYYCPGDKEV